MKLFYELGYRYFRMPWEMGPREELMHLVESGRITPCSDLPPENDTSYNLVKGG